MTQILSVVAPLFHCLLTTHQSLMFVFFSSTFHCTLVSCWRNCCVHAVRLSLIASVWSLLIMNILCWLTWYFCVDVLPYFSFSLFFLFSSVENVLKTLVKSCRPWVYFLIRFYIYCSLSVWFGRTVVFSFVQNSCLTLRWVTCSTLVMQNHRSLWTIYTHLTVQMS